MNARYWINILAVLAIAPLARPGSAQQDALGSTRLPGLVAEYQSDGVTSHSIDEAILFVGHRGHPDERLPRRPLQAKWTGQLFARENGAFTFSIFSTGRIRLRVAGREILSVDQASSAWHHAPPLELSYGRVDIELDYECASAAPSLGLYWQGPSFELEPITAKYFSHVAPDEEQAEQLPLYGLGLSRSLRCAACHDFPRGDPLLPAPSLSRLSGNLRPSWLVARLTASVAADSGSRMPHFGMHANDAMAVSAALFDASEDSPVPADLLKDLERSAKRAKKGDPAPRLEPSAEQGAQTFATKGCIACHRVSQIAEPFAEKQNLFAGGDLTLISHKRTRDFLFRWLSDPAQVNRHHRMPIFDLTPLEQLDLVEFLSGLGSDASHQDTQAAGDVQRGRGLIARYRCGACHDLPASLRPNAARTALPQVDSDSAWDGGCLAEPSPSLAIPGYDLEPEDRQVLREYLMSASGPSQVRSGAQLLVENNCLACHARDLEPGIASHFPQLLEDMPELAPRLAAMVPPSLSSVGDKLKDAAILAAVGRQEAIRREWLDVRMPTFAFDEEQKQTLVDHFVSRDRIPQRPVEPIELPTDKATELAASRLVTAEGFGCQSCHQIADSEPPNVALNAHGTDLTMLGQRIRPSWFLRWVHNPARIVPRMEMPAIQSPAKGVLGDSLELQLAALWKTLNTPGFQPPKPNPVRTVRNHNRAEAAEPTRVLTDVLEIGERTYLRPLVFGLPNRSNFLFDLEAAQLQTWWLGDTARQYTRGKSWYWEIGTQPLVDQAVFLERIAIEDSSGGLWTPSQVGQVAVQLDQIVHDAGQASWSGKLHLSNGSALRSLSIWQRFAATEMGADVTTQVEGLGPGESLVIECGGFVSLNDMHLVARFGQTGTAVFSTSDANWFAGDEHHIVARPKLTGADSMAWTTAYSTNVTPDSVPLVELMLPKQTPKQIDCVPGYSGLQLPLPNVEMPISFAWNPDGQLFVGSLKGRVLQALDSDGDELQDLYHVISDEIPTPYGLYFGEDGLDALAKFALLRLSPPAVSGQVWDARVVADGWGYTNDYHDWAVGLERDPQGNYYLALPCQQDDRSPAAAYLRGHALKLIPNQASQAGRAYRIESIAAGLRFPMGIARSPSGELFTSDNQGNYNPFNELNHLRPGRRYGFINKLENKQDIPREFESPAINLPHPWTRSVNGICFLRTPDKVLQQTGKTLFGAFEGHLLGCEMNNRALIRMSLQKVGDTYQGAAYPFSLQTAAGELGLEGPIVCAISPQGDIFVGNLQDSGWGGGQNTGSIVRFRPDQELPCGIAVVEASNSGFSIQFTSPVDAETARDIQNYAIRSYQRISTPAYGGEDQDERIETIDRLQVSEDLRHIELGLDNLREGFVYEINIAAIAPDAQALVPSQAHYTLRSIPQ